MRIGYVNATEHGQTNRLLAALADRLAAKGLRLAGAV